MAALGAHARVFAGGARAARLLIAAALAGFLLLALLAARDPQKAAFSYLAAFVYALSIQLGALAFLMITHAANATWTVPIRRLCEAIASGLFATPLLLLPVLLSVEQLYPWAAPQLHGDAHAHSGVFPDKRAYLNTPFFIARSAGYVAVWVGLCLLLRRWSAAGDADPRRRAAERARARRISAAGLPALGLTLTFAAIDWIMSLEPEWFSSMYGIYFFAGAFVAGIAVLTIATRSAERSGFLNGLVSGSHYHALGRLLLAFTIFWAYIAYFQAFLIYIADKPEEVTFYVRRTSGSWEVYNWLLGVGHFAIPFLLLLLRGLKFRARTLVPIAWWIAVMHYFDVYWLVMPVLHRAGVRPHLCDLAALLAVLGVAAASSLLLLRGRQIVADNDPLLLEGAAYRSV
jgi:hypothetical protein